MIVEIFCTPSLQWVICTKRNDLLAYKYTQAFLYINKLAMTNRSFHDLTFRSIEAEDKDRLKELHEEFFPVKYSDQFYDNASKGVGIKSLPLFSLIVLRDDEVVGFLLSQFMPLDKSEDWESLDIYKDGKNAQDTDVMYILTIGCIPELRRSGLASKLVNMCVEYSTSNPKCGAVYLHVLTTNQAAIKLYEKNSFIFYHTRYNYYDIEGEKCSAYLYLLPLNNFIARVSLFHQIWLVCDDFVAQVGSALRNILSWGPEPRGKVEDHGPIVYGSDFA